MPFIGNKPTAVPLTGADLNDNIITSAKIADGTIGIADLSATGTKDSTTFLRGDNIFSTISAGITEADHYIVNTNVSITGSTELLITDWSRNSQNAKLGTGMSVSSGIWTFPSTGIWSINTQLLFFRDGNTSRYVWVAVHNTTDNSTYNELARGLNGQYYNASQWWSCASLNILFDCTNTATDKIQIKGNSENDTTVSGDATISRSMVSFTRLGDT